MERPDNMNYPQTTSRQIMHLIQLYSKLGANGEHKKQIFILENGILGEY